MLTQEELDKLLAQGPEGTENPKDKDKQEPGKTDGSQGPEAATPSPDNLDWSQAFDEAAAGGDAAAAKAVKDEETTSEAINSLLIIPQMKKTNPPRTASNRPIFVEYFKRPNILSHLK